MTKCDFCRYSIPTEKGFICDKPAPPNNVYIPNTPPWTPPQQPIHYDPYAFCVEAITIMSNTFKQNNIQ